MEKYKNRLMYGKVKKSWLYLQLIEMLEKTSGKVIDQGSQDVGYQLGHHFGTQDTLKAVIDLLDRIEEDDPYKQPIDRVMGRNVYER